MHMAARKIRKASAQSGRQAVAQPARSADAAGPAGRWQTAIPPATAAPPKPSGQAPRSRQAAKTVAPGSFATLREEVASGGRTPPERRGWTEWDYAVAAGVVAMAIAPVQFFWAPPFWILALMCSSDRPPGRRRPAAASRHGTEPQGKHR